MLVRICDCADESIGGGRIIQNVQDVERGEASIEVVCMDEPK